MNEANNNKKKESKKFSYKKTYMIGLGGREDYRI